MGNTIRDDASATVFAVVASKGADGQQRIEAEPDQWWAYMKSGPPPVLRHAGHMLVSMGQDTGTARLTAVASDERYVGQGWMPAPNVAAGHAKALAVFLNSTPGRLLIMRTPGKKLDFPSYAPSTWRSLPVPDLEERNARKVLVDCWESTRTVTVPQFRDGYTEVRRVWDAAVAEALGWDVGELADLGEALACEPHVRGVADGQWKA